MRPLRVEQMPAKANSGRSSHSANQTTSFFTLMPKSLLAIGIRFGYLAAPTVVSIALVH
jgi:hypothetical protein